MNASVNNILMVRFLLINQIYMFVCNCRLPVATKVALRSYSVRKYGVTWRYPEVALRVPNYPQCLVCSFLIHQVTVHSIHENIALSYKTFVQQAR